MPTRKAHRRVCIMSEIITDLTFLYQGVKYNWTETREEKEGYDLEGIFYYNTEGDNSCDCNRGTLIGIEDMPCGNEIKLIGISIKYV